MLNFYCDCDCRVFRANRRVSMIQCVKCNKRYIWKNGAWKEFQTWKEAKKLVRKVVKKFITNPPKAFIEEQTESMGQWFKKHGIKRGKKAPEEKPLVEKFLEKSALQKQAAQKLQEKRTLEKKWAEAIVLLRMKKKVVFDKHQHKGKLRGRHIAKAAHRDLQKLGIKTRLTFGKNKSGILEPMK